LIEHDVEPLAELVANLLEATNALKTETFLQLYARGLIGAGSANE
jgi:hypothetical protein